MSYFTDWGHAYVVHFGAWISFMFAATVYKNGLPEKTDAVIPLLKTAIVLALILSIFSSHSHTHYLSHLAGK